jgi:nucleoside-diphosphate-sugar epimerase
MNLFVIGATGRTGREVVQQGLARGHTVTALVRSAVKMDAREPALHVIEGDPLDSETVARALVESRADAVITTLGPHEPFKPSTLMRDSARALVAAMTRASVRRVVVLSAAAHFPGFFSVVARTVLREHMRDSLGMESVVRASSLDWTLARPPRLTGGGSMRYRARDGAPPFLGLTLPRRALAAFMLDAAEQRLHVRSVVGVAS